MTSTTLHRRDTERAILGACLWNDLAIESASKRLLPGMFQSPQHRALFDVVCKMQLAGESVDVLTVRPRLLGDLWDDEHALTTWLLDLHESTPSVSNLKHYIGQLVDHAMQDSVSSVVDEAVSELANGSGWQSALNVLEGGVVRLSAQSAGLSPESSDETVKGTHTMRLLEWFYEGEGDGYPLPWSGLQTAYNGLHKSKLTTVCGYSSDGKSVVLMQLADAALSAGAKVWYVSLEMPPEEVLGRWAAMREYVSYPMLAMRQGESDPMVRFGEYIDNHELTVTGRTISPDRIRAIQMRERYDVIVFDHLHRLTSDREELEEAVRSFKNIALDLDCSVVLGAQVSRREDARPEPNLNMVRGTAGIEHESDLILSVWRERLPGRPPDDPSDLAIIRSLKARFGRRGIMQPVVFHPKYMRFNER